MVTFVSQEKISALKKQASHIVQQAQREQDHFVKEKNNLIMMLQRVSTSCSVAASSWAKAASSGECLYALRTPLVSTFCVIVHIANSTLRW